MYKKELIIKQLIAAIKRKCYLQQSLENPDASEYCDISMFLDTGDGIPVYTGSNITDLRLNKTTGAFILGTLSFNTEQMKYAETDGETTMLLNSLIAAYEREKKAQEERDDNLILPNTTIGFLRFTVILVSRLIKPKNRYKFLTNLSEVQLRNQGKDNATKHTIPKKLNEASMPTFITNMLTVMSSSQSGEGRKLDSSFTSTLLLVLFGHPEHTDSDDIDIDIDIDIGIDENSHLSKPISSFHMVKSRDWTLLPNRVQKCLFHPLVWGNRYDPEGKKRYSQNMSSIMKALFNDTNSYFRKQWEMGTAEYLASTERVAAANVKRDTNYRKGMAKYLASTERRQKAHEKYMEATWYNLDWILNRKHTWIIQRSIPFLKEGKAAFGSGWENRTNMWFVFEGHEYANMGDESRTLSFLKNCSPFGKIAGKSKYTIYGVKKTYIHDHVLHVSETLKEGFEKKYNIRFISKASNESGSNSNSGDSSSSNSGGNGNSGDGSSSNSSTSGWWNEPYEIYVDEEAGEIIITIETKCMALAFLKDIFPNLAKWDAMADDKKPLLVFLWEYNSLTVAVPLGTVAEPAKVGEEVLPHLRILKQFYWRTFADAGHQVNDEMKKENAWKMVKDQVGCLQQKMYNFPQNNPLCHGRRLFKDNKILRKQEDWTFINTVEEMMLDGFIPEIHRDMLDKKFEEHLNRKKKEPLPKGTGWADANTSGIGKSFRHEDFKGMKEHAEKHGEKSILEQAKKGVPSDCSLFLFDGATPPVTATKKKKTAKRKSNNSGINRSSKKVKITTNSSDQNKRKADEPTATVQSKRAKVGGSSSASASFSHISCCGKLLAPEAICCQFCGNRVESITSSGTGSGSGTGTSTVVSPSSSNHSPTDATNTGHCTSTFAAPFANLQTKTNTHNVLSPLTIPSASTSTSTSTSR